MRLLLLQIGESVQVTAEPDGCWFRGDRGHDLSDRRTWPPHALRDRTGAALALEVEQMLEQGLAEPVDGDVRVAFEGFEQIDHLGLSFGRTLAPACPFGLRIERRSDLGRPDFQYRYEFQEGGRAVGVRRVGCFLEFPAAAITYRLDPDTFALVDAMDQFNARLPEARKAEAWVTFARIKGLAAGLGARLDTALLANDVVIPAAISLSVREAEDGLTFEPACAELPEDELAQAFRRNRDVQPVYSIDAPGNRRRRVVVGKAQQEVLRRMKKVQGVRGDEAERLRRDPAAVFDGVLDAVEIAYGPRVTGIGAFEFTPVPKSNANDGSMAELFAGAREIGAGPAASTVLTRGPDGSEQPVLLSEAERGELRGLLEAAIESGQSTVRFQGKEILADPGLAASLAGDAAPVRPAQGSKDGYLLIHTDDESLLNQDQRAADAARRGRGAESRAFNLAAAVADPALLKPHQEEGIRWLDACARIPGRRGVLLADDMGMGKTFQVLAFLAGAIESDLFPELAREAAPWRPALVVLPPILVENETWQSDMRRFFRDDGVIFQPVLSLHGQRLQELRLDRGKEVELGKPLLDISEIRRHRVVITTYDTVKNYQHSFACLHEGEPLWSVIVSDEAQEYKTPNSKVSHALKALSGRFHVASTGTPVENRLLDLWNLFDTLQPALLGTAREFVRKYEEPKAVDALREELLFGKAHAFLVRRDKSSTPGLPRKHERRLICQMNEREVALHREVVGAVSGEAKAMHVLSALGRLALLYQHPTLLAEGWKDVDPVAAMLVSSKLQAVVGQLEQIRLRGEKAILFARHVRAQQLLARVLGAHFGIDVRIINGETTRGGAGASRKRILEEFRARPGFSALVLSPFVAGVGLTIVEANHVFHYGRWWNPAVEAQATDRVYRLGQTRDVHVYLPILQDPAGKLERSFDQALDQLIEAKRSLARDFLRPAEDEGETAQELFQALQAEASAPTSSPAEADLAGMDVADFEALVAILLGRDGWTIERPAPGVAPGATWVGRRGGTVTVARVIPGAWAPGVADLSTVSGAARGLQGAGHGPVMAGLWSAREISPSLRAAARDVTLLGRAEIGLRLMEKAVAWREIWHLRG